MGGAGPYIDIAELDSQLSELSRHAGLPDLSLEDSEAIWRRATQFFIEKHVVSVLKEDGWEEEVTGASNHATGLSITAQTQRLTLINITSDKAQSLVFPASIHDLMDQNNRSFWVSQFRAQLDAKRHNRNSDTMYVTAFAPCIVDYVYLLQIIVPGFITLVREDEIDEVGDFTTTRILPDLHWVEQQEDMLTKVLDSKERFQEVLSAARDHKRAFASSASYVRYGRSDDDRDFTACDKECGYCGHCDY